MTINTLIQTPYQWPYNLIIEISAIGCIIEMLGNVIEKLKYVFITLPNISMTYPIALISIMGLYSHFDMALY